MMIRCLLATAVFALSVVPAQADLVFFGTGRTMSVKSYRVEGAQLVLTLRTGGEMTCDASLVSEIRPDEIPYPEPEAILPEPSQPAPVSANLRENARYDGMIRKFSAEQGVDATLIRAVIQVESGYRPAARSPKGAVGLMQVMPSTGRQYGVRNLYEPAANIEAGVKHLKALLSRFPLRLALAAYNAGEGAVERFRGVPPYPETQAYVSKILALVGG